MERNRAMNNMVEKVVACKLCGEDIEIMVWDSDRHPLLCDRCKTGLIDIVREGVRKELTERFK
jgi:hypothetical protein